LKEVVDGTSEKGEAMVLSVVGDGGREEEVVSLKRLGRIYSVILTLC
jgi:hypothetical protein